MTAVLHKTARRRPIASYCEFATPKLYAESFRGQDHLRQIIEEAQAVLDDALAASVPGAGTPGRSP